MKKIVIVVLIVVGIIALSSSNSEMIRIRVLANSNDDYDQKVKGEIVDIVKREFGTIMSGTTNINDARNKISDNLDRISNKIDDYLSVNNVKYNFKINFGLNYFPPKQLNGKAYEEGYYESVLVTLGEGKGDNWWCVLFPSICLTEENAQYESFIKNIFDKIFY